MPISVGDYGSDNILRFETLVEDTTALVTYSPSLAWVKGMSFQLITEAAPARSITHDAADAVVASTGTWHFVNGAFKSGDVGATMTVANASHAGNNGTFTILTVVDLTHVTTAVTGLVNETFGSSVTMTLSDFAPLQGAWSVKASNNYVPAVGMGVPSLNQLPNSGKWSAVANSDFSPAIEDVTDESSQYVQLDPFDGHYLEFTFTPTQGAGIVTITYFAKGTR